MPFIIWGSRGITSTKGGGKFRCPQCGPCHYTHKVVRRYFTLYWIPLFPLRTAVEYVECAICGEMYTEDVLSHDPAEQIAFVSQYDNAARRLMALMVLADGKVERQELQMMVDLSALLLGGKMSLDEARQEVAAASAGPRDPVAHVSKVKNLLTTASKIDLLAVATTIARSDGHVADEENLLLIRIGEALGLPMEHMAAELAGDQ